MLFSKRLGSLSGLAKNSMRVVSKRPLTLLNIPVVTFHFSNAKSERMEFKAETKKLLDIVAKSIYTDSEVFLRELLSNSSDALEKQRFQSQSSEDLCINIEILENKNQLIIQDNGIGMTKEDLISNLGTIAKSGSKEFMQSLEKDNKQSESNIIGQFGVGFYSSFIVADHVEVISKVSGQPAHKWSSNGDGTFEIEETTEDQFERGTKIILHIKESTKNFLEKTELQRIAQKYSNFINFPIALNGEGLNLVKALWSREKRDISDKEYQDFYEYLTGKFEKYQYRFHFASEVPLQLKSILYIPRNHEEKFGAFQEKGEVSLYSKKVLIKKDCKEVLLPPFLRFVKGVVDCEDIPLNISREGYQDSALMNKLKSYLTKRVIKSLKEESEKDPNAYNKWYKDFEMFIKEGSIDHEYKKDMALLNRYGLNTQDGAVSLKDYLALKKPTQDRILYMFAPNRSAANESPYAYPLTKAGIPVLITNTHIDEMIFRELDVFEGLKFSNIETDTEDVERILKGVGEDKVEQKGERIKEEELTPFSLWIKQQLQPFVDKVNISKKSIKGPAMVISPISSSMRQMNFMRQMMEERVKAGLPQMNLQNLTFEYDAADPFIFKLNEFRKVDSDGASILIRQLFDNCCIEAGLESDAKSMISRLNLIMEKLIEHGMKNKE